MNDMIGKFIIALILFFMPCWIVVTLLMYSAGKEQLYTNKKTKSMKWGKLLLHSFGFTILFIVSGFLFIVFGKI
jgi:hypothetical protein